jgi:ADP-heptose:LPS heptosyltransferase
MTRSSKRILIIRLTAMGDVAMTVAAVAALQKRYIELKISVLTNPFFQPFFRGVPGLEFVPFDKNGRHKGFYGLIRLWRDIRREHPVDAVADLHNVLRSKVLRMLFRLSGSRTAAIDKGRREKRALIRFFNKILKPLRPTIRRYGDVFGRLGYPVDIPPRAERKKYPVPEVFGNKENTWIGIAPFAQHEGKRYPPERMERVIDRLSRDGRHTLFIFGGGAEEQSVADDWAAKYPNTVSAVGKVKLAQELDLISNLDCLVSMDSSAMHMASLYAVPVVSVWGGTHPYTGFLGWGQDEHNAVQLDLPCRPCSVYGSKPCRYGDYRCLQGIQPEEITDRILKIVR